MAPFLHRRDSKAFPDLASAWTFHIASLLSCAFAHAVPSIWNSLSLSPHFSWQILTLPPRVTQMTSLLWSLSQCPLSFISPYHWGIINLIAFSMLCCNIFSNFIKWEFNLHLFFFPPQNLFVIFCLYKLFYCKTSDSFGDSENVFSSLNPQHPAWCWYRADLVHLSWVSE